MLKNKLIVATLLVLGMGSANAFGPNDCTADACQAKGSGPLVDYCLALSGPESCEAIDCGVGYYKKKSCSDNAASNPKCDKAEKMIAEGVVNMEKVNKAAFDAFMAAGNSVVH